MDDVLSESNQIFLSVLEREFGKKVDYSQIKTFDLQKSFGLSDEEYSLFFDCIHTPEEMIKHTPVPGAKQTLRLWHEKGYKISILTGRPLHTLDISLEWLERNEFIHDSFSIVNKYGRPSSEGNMSMSLQTLSAQFFDLAVEDSAHMAHFLSEKMGVKVALIDRPWNRDISFNKDVYRCADWNDVRNKFERL